MFFWKRRHQRIEVAEERRERNHGSPQRGQRQQAESISNGYSEKNKDRYLQGKEGGRGQSLSSFTELVVLEMSDGGRNKKDLKPVK